MWECKLPRENKSFIFTKREKDIQDIILKLKWFQLDKNNKHLKSW